MKRKMRVTIMKMVFRSIVLCLFAALSANLAAAQTTEFTYQGRLADSGLNPSGSYDFEFKLFDAETGGSEIGIQQKLNVSVVNGIFSVRLDFGDNFNGSARFLEIGVRTSGSSDPFTLLSPRQPFTSTPYAIKSLNAETAANALQLGGINPNQYILTTDPRLNDERNPAPNSPNYIQNTTARQTGSNFNISGDGTLGGNLSADTVNAVTQFNINGQRVLTALNLSTIVGLNAGGALTTGTGNAFFGFDAGRSTTAGRDNSFFGHSAGQANTTGFRNAFFGFQAGTNNLTGVQNSIFGEGAGAFNTTGSNNSLMGNAAGRRALGSENSFFGSQAGLGLVFGDRNTAVGFQADFSVNVGVGVSSATLLGAGAVVRSPNPISFATAIGAGAEVTTSNTVMLGRSLDTVQIPGALNVAGVTNFSGTLTGNRINSLTDFAIRGETVVRTLGNTGLFVGFGAGGANSSGSGTVFVGNFAGENNTIGTGNSFFGNNAGNANTTGSLNTFIGFRAGQFNTGGLFNSFFGSNAGISNINGSENTFLGMDAGRANTSGNFNFFGGQGAGRNSLSGNRNVFVGLVAGLNNAVGGNNVFVGAEAGKTNVGGNNNTVIGNNADLASTELNFATAVGAGAVVSSSNTIQLGRSTDTVNVSGFVTLQILGLGGNQVLCRNGSLQIGICSSSLRYKTNIKAFNAGMNLVKRLRPITFDWKTDGSKDLGLAAEEVAEIEPLLVNYNSQGEVEGVKYDRLGVVLLNAVREQQSQIEEQKKIIQRQQTVIDGLKKLICRQTPDADVCKEEQK